MDWNSRKNTCYTAANCLQYIGKTISAPFPNYARNRKVTVAANRNQSAVIQLGAPPLSYKDAEFFPRSFFPLYLSHFLPLIHPIFRLIISFSHSSFSHFPISFFLFQLTLFLLPLQSFSFYSVLYSHSYSISVCFLLILFSLLYCRFSYFIFIL